MSWKPEVKIEGEFQQNGLVFATKAEAEYSANMLYNRWILCEDYRAVESDKPVNYRLLPDGSMSSVIEI